MTGMASTHLLSGQNPKAEALDGAPVVVKEWQVGRDNFTGMSFLEQDRVLQKRRVPPLVNPYTKHPTESTSHIVFLLDGKFEVCSFDDETLQASD